MRICAFISLLFLGLTACSRNDQPSRVVVESADILPALVGRYVEFTGAVSNTPVPQIYGVDLWGLENFAKQRLRVSGTLQCTVIALTGKDTARAVDSGRDDFVPPTLRNPGTYYRLQNLRYELLK